MNKTHTYRFDAPPEKVAAVLTDLEFHLEMDRTRDDAAGSSVEGERRDADQVEFTMITKEYKRTRTMSLDRNQTEEGRTHFRWEPRDRTLTWAYTPASEAKRVDVRGKYRVEPDGQGSRLVHDYSIDIRIPLIGGQIAKIVEKKFAESFPRFDATFRRFLAR